jgi:hypothetical protein
VGLDTNVIEEIVKWRMGSAYDTPILDWRDSRLNFDTPALLDSALAGGVTMSDAGFEVHCPLGREGYSPAKHQRLVETAEDMFKARANDAPPLSAFLVMNDARIFSSVEYLGRTTDATCMQISYARPVEQQWRSKTELVLWPLPEYVRHWRLPSLTPVAWHERRSQLLWRGQTTGMSYALGHEAQPIFTGIRQMRRWLNVWLRDDIGDNINSFRSWAGTYQRLIAVTQCLNIPDTDVRFVPMWDGDTRSINAAGRILEADVSSPRLDMMGYMARRQECKYVLSISGNDVPSSLRQDLLSGCLVLMPRPFWESVWFFGLKPNVHYIPLRADLADLEERLQWCRDNDAACMEIAKAGRAFALQYFDPALELAVQSRLVSRLAHQTLLPSVS